VVSAQLARSDPPSDSKHNTIAVRRTYADEENVSASNRLFAAMMPSILIDGARELNLCNDLSGYERNTVPGLISNAGPCYTHQ
jgi:hypothetical protein